MKTKSSIWFVVLLGGMTCSSYAVGVPHFTIDRVTEEASLILVGDITEIKDLGVARPLQFRGQWPQANAYSVDISVRRTIKGPILDHITVTYTLPTVYIGYRSLHTGTRIVFLSGQGNTLRLADPYYPDFPAVPNTADSETPSFILRARCSGRCCASSNHPKHLPQTNIRFSGSMMHFPLTVRR